MLLRNVYYALLFTITKCTECNEGWKQIFLIATKSSLQHFEKSDQFMREPSVSSYVLLNLSLKNSQLPFVNSLIYPLFIIYFIRQICSLGVFFTLIHYSCLG